MTYTLKPRQTSKRARASTSAQNSRFIIKGKSRQPKSRQPKSRQPKSRQPKSRQPKSRQPKSRQPKSRQPKSSQLIPQKILSGHPALSKKRKNKRNKYLSRNEVSPFRSVKDHLKDFNSPLAIV
jgi:hypothetical protein